MGRAGQGLWQNGFIPIFSLCINNSALRTYKEWCVSIVSSEFRNRLTATFRQHLTLTLKQRDRHCIYRRLAMIFSHRNDDVFSA